MEYKTVEEAKNLNGLRLALTAGVPGPWSEAAKALFRIKGINYIPVFQEGGGANEELLAWTGHRNAPTALYNDEPARVTWLDILNLAERLAPEPALVPADFDERIAMIGLLNELAGENGLAWNGRLIMLDAMIKQYGDSVMVDNPLFSDYGHSPQAAAEAANKVINILGRLTERAERQKAGGSPFLCGDALSALDIYFACFSQMLDTLPHDVNPMPQFLRKVWAQVGAGLKDAGYALPLILVEHRDFIFREYIGLPLEF